MKKIAWITLTNGRKEYLYESRKSWYENVEGNFSSEVIVDTSGQYEYRQWLLKTYPNAKVFSLSKHKNINNDWNIGIRDAYEYFFNIASEIDCEYIFHTEDDYVLQNKIVLEDSINILDFDTDISQVHFIRQPWTKEEKDAGGVLKYCQSLGFDMIEKEKDNLFWVEHRAYFTFGPSIYKKDICFLDRDLQINPEISITQAVFKDLKKKSATFGKIEDKNFVEHIGKIRIW